MFGSFTKESLSASIGAKDVSSHGFSPLTGAWAQYESACPWLDIFGIKPDQWQSWSRKAGVKSDCLQIESRLEIEITSTLPGDW